MVAGYERRCEGTDIAIAAGPSEWKGQKGGTDWQNITTTWSGHGLFWIYLAQFPSTESVSRFQAKLRDAALVSVSSWQPLQRRLVAGQWNHQFELYKGLTMPVIPTFEQLFQSLHPI